MNASFSTAAWLYGNLAVYTDKIVEIRFVGTDAYDDVYALMTSFVITNQLKN